MHDPAAAKVLASKMNPQIAVAADNLDGIYKTYFREQGFVDDDVDDFWRAMQSLREKNGDFLAHGQTRKMSKIEKSMEVELRTGEIMMDDREWDFAAIAERLIRTHSKQKHVGPAWNVVKAEFDALDASGTAPVELMGMFEKYMGQVKHAPDHFQITMARAMNQMTQKITGKSLPPGEMRSPVEAFLTTNYFVNMAWNTGTALRNYMQPVMTVYPILGKTHFGAGYGEAWKAFNSKELMERYAKLGVISRDVEPMAAAAIRQEMGAAGTRITGGGKFQDMKREFTDMGWTAFRSAENSNRIMSYKAMLDSAKEHGKKFMAREISWNQFHEASRLDFLDTLNGPIGIQIRDLMHAGKLEKAAHIMALRFTEKTQFIYRRGNTPLIMQSTVGRLLGQYGTWPSWYTSYMGDMVFQGSRKNRLKSVSRWVGANAAIMGVGSQVFGVDTARWAFFSPMGYAGGPIKDLAVNSAAALSSPGTVTPKSWGLPTSEDPVTVLNASRAKEGYKQFTPLVPWGGMRNMKLSYEALLDEDWATAAKRFAGFSPLKEE